MSDAPDLEVAPSAVPGIRVSAAVLAALLLLTAGTVVLAFVPLPATVHVAGALAIATIKAALVAAFFMHLRHEERLIRVMASAGLLWLALLFLLVLTDLMTRP